MLSGIYLILQPYFASFDIALHLTFYTVASPTIFTISQLSHIPSSCRSVDASHWTHCGKYHLCTTSLLVGSTSVTRSAHALVCFPQVCLIAPSTGLGLGQLSLTSCPRPSLVPCLDTHREHSAMHFRRFRTSCLLWNGQHIVYLCIFLLLCSTPQSLAGALWDHFLNKIFACKHLLQRLSFGIILAKTHVLFPMLRLYPPPPSPSKCSIIFGSFRDLFCLNTMSPLINKGYIPSPSVDA